MASQQLLVDEALLAVLELAFEAFIPSVRRKMNVQSDFIRKLFVAEVADPLLVWLQMPAHVLVVGIL